MQQASDQMLGRIENLREQVSVLKLQVAGMEGLGQRAEALPIASGVSQLHRILGSMTILTTTPTRSRRFSVGVVMDLARSTAEAMRVVGRAPQPYDAVVTDMGREEHGEARPQAGLELIRGGLREQDVTSPVIVYASARAVGGAREELAKLGGQGTSSATVLLEILGRLRRVDGVTAESL